MATDPNFMTSMKGIIKTLHFCVKAITIFFSFCSCDSVAYSCVDLRTCITLTPENMCFCECHRQNNNQRWQKSHSAAKAMC